MPRQLQPWEAACASLRPQAAAEVLKAYHAGTVCAITDMPDGAPKTYASAAVLVPELTIRDKLGVETGHIYSLDEEFRRAVGNLHHYKRLNLQAAGIAALKARFHLAIAPWHDGHPALKEACDGTDKETAWLRGYVDACKEARQGAAEELTQMLSARAMGRTYGAAPVVVETQGDQPHGAS